MTDKINMQINQNREFILISKKEEAENIVSLFFKPVDGLDFNFIAGQYVSVKLPALGEARSVKRPSIFGRSKCYTISSAPRDKLICLTVKRQGEFSSGLIDTAINDKLIFGGPYGRFYPEENCEDIVFIAGGIGVTPFFSVIKDRSDSKTRPRIALLYSNKTIASVAFFDELNMLAQDKIINTIYFLTQEQVKYPEVQEYSRINKELLKKHLGYFDKRNYYLCGSIQFVNSIWKDLKESGVREENIFTESFY